MELANPMVLEPEVWKTIRVEVWGIGLPGEPPDRLAGEIYFTNPVDDPYIAGFSLKRNDSAKSYDLDDRDRERRIMMKTMWRQPWHVTLRRSVSRRLGIRAFLGRFKR